MPAPKRRWLRFSLRTLFIGMTAFGVWIGYEFNWIRQRHGVLSSPHVLHYVSGIDGRRDSQAPAPLSLRIFGERGCCLVYLFFVDDERAALSSSSVVDRNDLLNAQERLEVQRVRRLFPEARSVFGAVISSAEAELEETRKGAIVEYGQRAPQQN